MRQGPALTPSRITVAASVAVIGASSRKRRSLSATIFWMSSSDRLETSVPIEVMRARAWAICVASITSDSVPLWILRELDRIEVPIWPGITTEHLIWGALIRTSAMCVVIRSPCGSRSASQSRFVSAIAAAKDVAHRDIAALGDQLANELSPHSAAATSDDGYPACEILHGLCPLRFSPFKKRAL